MKKTLSFIGSVLFGFLALFTLVFNIVEQDYAVGILFFVLYISVAGCCFMSYVFDDDKKDSSESNVAERPTTQSKIDFSGSSECYSKEEIAVLFDREIHRIIADADEIRNSAYDDNTYRVYCIENIEFNSEAISIIGWRSTKINGKADNMPRFQFTLRYCRGPYYQYYVENEYHDNIDSRYKNVMCPCYADFRGYLMNKQFNDFRFDGNTIIFNKFGNNTYT